MNDKKNVIVLVSFILFLILQVWLWAGAIASRQQVAELQTTVVSLQSEVTYLHGMASTTEIATNLTGQMYQNGTWSGFKYLMQQILPTIQK